jgi:metallo-beta-lactamase family protein
MKLTFHGAAETTTGSQHLLEINGKRILLDCGLYQGRRDDANTRNRNFGFKPETLDAVILSHAHIDHSGNLPNLVKQGFRGNIYTTFATRDLCSIMLEDSAKIQTLDAQFLNKKARKAGRAEDIVPLYSPQDAEKCLRQFVAFGYRRPMPITDGVTLTFIDAGHILGSAQCVLDLHEFATGKKKRLVFSGDIGRGNNEMLNDPEAAEDVDVVLMESTYGGKEHVMEAGARSELEEIVSGALANGGKIIIPAFAVERTQQVLVVLQELIEQKAMPAVPIIVDSPLAVNATEIFRMHPECFNEEVYDDLFSKNSPFSMDNLKLVRKNADSKKLNELEGPFIIVSASGMCEAGRVLHHLANNIEDPRTTVLFVGHCAENTLGWKIRQGHKEVSILGQPYKVKAKVKALDCFSGHADHSELMGYFGRMTGPKEKVYLVHGEAERSAAFATALLAANPGKTVEVAKQGKTVEF